MGGGRIAALDLARVAALLAMAVFHFTYDLEMFGLIAQGTIGSPPWRVFSQLIAGSFLFLAGVSLWLAHGRAFRARAFWRRIGMIAGAAALVTLGTWIAMPGAFVFFGILHAIAAASLVAALFLRVPALITLAVALAVWVAPDYLSGPGFDAPLLLWLGLSTYFPSTIDFAPVFPWVAPTLAGLALAKLAGRAGLWEAMAAKAPPGRAMRALTWPGRHSLAVYLLHQPVLVSLVWLYVQTAAAMGG